MKRLLSSNILFLLGLAIILVSNIMALAGVALNRMGAEETRITLSERELTLPWSSRENSGLSMRLNWRFLDKDASDIYASGRWGHPEWLDERKLIDLGFDGRTLRKYLKSDAGKSKRPLPQKAFVVLELGGRPYAEAVKRAEDLLAKTEKREDESNLDYIRDRVKGEHESYSRLFAVDAGLDPETLREQYPDTSRFLILKGVIKPGIYFHEKVSSLSGHIKNLTVESLHVPLSLRPVLDPVRTSGFAVDLVVGSRYEPWIEAIYPTDEVQSPVK